MTTSIILVAAVLASFALGVLIAYGICSAMFSIFRIHSRQVAAERARRQMIQAASLIAEN
ncbi:MAG: hypothetical protein FWD64_08930 [Acidobacteriaceae bacterium]|nr:hypothetical protein [Acidobacteriaceae bacterium]